MAYTKISYELKGDIAIISFNDPSTLNACGVDTAQELLHAFEVAADEARCTILTGAGRGFCSGANLGPGGLSVKLSHEGSKPDAGRALTTHYNPLMQAIREHPHPVITAVNGPAAGVGCSLALVGVWTLVTTFLIAKAVGLVTPMRVDPETETNGLDIASHGERAYELTS